MTTLGLTEAALAQRSGMPLEELDEFIRGKRGATSEVARSLSQALGTTPEFWVTLQVNHDRVTSGLDVVESAADRFVATHSEALKKLKG